MKGKIIIGALVVAAGLGTLHHFGLSPLPQRTAEQSDRNTVTADAAPLVTVVKPDARVFRDLVLVSGSLVAREEILVAPEIEGLRVVDLFADAGSAVKKGEVLATLVADQLDAQAAQNDAALARADAAIAQARSQIVQSEALAKEAVAQLQRAVPLKKEGYLSGSTYDQRKSAADSAEAQVIAARDGLKAAEAEKAQVEAQRRELEWRRRNTSVTAPADGVVSERNARIGALASAAGSPMFRIIRKSEVELDAEIVETDLYKVKEGQTATVSIPGYDDVTGTVRLVSPAVDQTTRLGHVRIFLGAQPQLKVGAFARGVIETGVSKGLAVPIMAVTHAADGSASVLVVSGDVVHKRTVKTGISAGGAIEIRDGLGLGDTVVARSGTFLRNGDRIRTAAPQTAAANGNGNGNGNAGEVE